MGQVYVAVDLETTGLNPERDAILELGAVRFRDGEVLDTFSQVVNPGRPIPPAIRRLTGIGQEEADRAPNLARVASAFRRFLGDAPLVGHNIGFDVAFLRNAGLYTANPIVDTWELALIVLPQLASYKLERLAAYLGIELAQVHRALADAMTSMHLFTALLERAAALPLPVLQQINRLATRSDWSLRPVFLEAERLAALRWTGRRTTASPARPETGLFAGPPPLEPKERPQPLAVDELTAMLEPGGRFAQAFARYEYRPPQVEMLRAVAQAFNEKRHLLVEAGTGTGKSVAYLIPALAWAVQTGQRVVVSSNTINLQDQLYHKDLPDLHGVLPFDFRVALLKGRNNYLCPRRLEQLMARPDLDPTELSVIARVLVWLQSTTTGDQSEITLANSRERAVWQRICADSATCSPKHCVEGRHQPCFFYQARARAEAAHVIIINHALLLADIAVENRALPTYKHLIVDEAHHLEEAATKAYTLEVDLPTFAARLRELAPAEAEERAVGRLADVATAVRNACPSDRAEPIIALTQALAEGVPTLEHRMADCLDAMARFVRERLEARQRWGEDNDEARNNYDVLLRITKKERVQPAWVDVEITGDNLILPLHEFIGTLLRLINALLDLSNYPITGYEELIADLEAILRDLGAVYKLFQAAIFEPDPNTIYWLRYSDKGEETISLNSAPLHVGDLIQNTIFATNETVILTSATLRTTNSFAYLRSRLKIETADELALPSPFDYKANALLYLPTDIPEPNQPNYEQKVQQAILELSLATQGRLMALFTSHAQLQRTAEALRPWLEEAGLSLYVQGEGGSRQQLLDEFRRSERGVILGTRSFWEGVDVQGEALSALVIARLPFAVPSDPIVAARSETIESSFYNYSVPEAILHLRQGFGRLIRSTTDRGVCVILDRRILSKPYGRLFVDSLPPCTQYRGPLADLPIMARRWLRGEPLPSAKSAPARGPADHPEFPDFLPEPPDWAFKW
ncbi:MAG: exonuclease domain-containing protein [Caldilineales bacterium]|nr:exonuclease domain-containing protein [Caldilineales bacterium]